MAAHVRRSTRSSNLVGDLVAGPTTGVANIPDAMASGVLAGANPVKWLYAIMVGTPLAAARCRSLRFSAARLHERVGHQRAGHHRRHGAGCNEKAAK